MMHVVRLAALCGTLLLVACQRQTEPAPPVGPAQTIALAVTGTHCEGCATRIREALQKLPGVVEVSASHAEQRVVVTGDQRVTADGLIAAIAKVDAKYVATVVPEAATSTVEAPLTNSAAAEVLAGAETLIAIGKPDAAVSALTEALKTTPADQADYPLLVLALGRAHQLAGQSAEAQARLQEFLAKWPEHAKAAEAKALLAGLAPAD